MSEYPVDCAVPYILPVAVTVAAALVIVGWLTAWIVRRLRGLA